MRSCRGTQCNRTHRPWRRFSFGTFCPPFARSSTTREEALHRRVVPDVAGTAHRADDAMIGHQPLELFAGVLAAPVGMVQQGVKLASSPNRHHQGVGDELRCHRCVHRPADHPADIGRDGAGRNDLAVDRFCSCTGSYVAQRNRSASVTPGTQFPKGLRAQSVRSRAVREFSFSADCSSRTAGRAFAELDELHFQIKKPARDLAGLSHLSRIAELELCNQMVPPNWPSGNRELARNLRTLDPRAR